MTQPSFCPHCGKPFAPDAVFCSSCGAKPFLGAAPSLLPGPRQDRIVRPRSERMIAGVCAGIALHYGWDIAVVRVLTVVFFLTTGIGIFFYLIAWLLLPDAQYALPNGPRQESLT